MFSENHYFRSSEAKAKSKSSGTSFLRHFFQDLALYHSVLATIFEKQKQKKHIKNELEYPIRPCLAVVILVVLKQFTEHIFHTAITDQK